MKFQLLFSFLLFFLVLTGNDGYVKVNKIYCSSSNKTCANVYCKVKPVSRTNSIFNVTCDFLRPTRGILADISLQHKVLGGNFKQVFNLRNLEMCKWVKIANGQMSSIGFIKDFINYINLTFVGEIRECPYKGKLNVINGSLDDTRPEVKSTIDRVQRFPNGDYKVDLKYHRNAVKGGSDEGDEKILGIIMFFEVYDRDNHLQSYDSLK